ncbi:MAG: NUDIX domain-containing protein [Fimbriimonas sp.]|nr:NUDIX domain-containing protein [Fimbriimonas sp.]
MKRFPTGIFGRQTLQFFPAPFRAPIHSFAGLVFPWQDESVLLADIKGRGWCIPSGRVEADETSKEAVIREAMEEAGAILKDVQYIGCYHISERDEVRWADCYTSRIDQLVEIGIKEESRGRRFVRIDELPEIYYQWNALTKRVFEHSFDVLLRSEGKPNPDR